MDTWKYKFKFLSFSTKPPDFSNQARAGSEFDEEVTQAMNQWGEQGYELSAYEYDGEVLYLIMSLSIEPKKDKKPKKS